MLIQTILGSITVGSMAGIYKILKDSMDAEDKVRLRLLYNAMSAAICGQTVPNKIIKKIINNDFEFKKNKED